MQRMIGFILAVAAATAFASQTAAADPPEGATFDAIPDAGVIISIFAPSEPVFVTNGFEVDLQIASKVKADGTVVRSIMVCLPLDVRQVWRSKEECIKKIDLPNEGELKNSPLLQNVVLYSGEPDKDASAADAEYLFRYITFASRPYSFRVNVTYNLPGDKTKSAASQTFKVHLQPPLSVRVLGGIAGAILLAVFVFTMHLWRKRGALTLKSVATKLWHSLIIFFVGAVTAAIFVLVAYRMTDVALPISFAVNDFYGGLVVGLFTFKIADWLAEQLRIE